MLSLLGAGRRAATGGYASGRLRGVSRSIRSCEGATMSQVETEIAEQPGALARLLKEGRAAAEEIGRPGPGVRPALRRHRGARQLRQRRALRAVPLRRPQPPGGVPGDAVAVHLLRRGALARGGAGHRRQPVGPVARHRGRGRVGAEAGCAHPRHHQPARLAARGGRRAHAAAPRRRGAGGGRDQDLHHPALRARHAERGARGERGAVDASSPPSPAWSSRRSPRTRGWTGRSTATATPTTSRSWGAASTTRPPSRWPSR